MNENHVPKIKTPERIILIAIAVTADLLNWIPGVNWIVTIITVGIYQFYFRMKKIPTTFSLLGNGAEAIPGVSIVPWITMAISATMYCDSNPNARICKKFAQLKALTTGNISGAAKAATVQIKTPVGGLRKAA